MSNIPSDCRNRMYYVIPFPVNSDGDGPVKYSECSKVLFQVWNQFFDEVGSFDYLADAINLCEALNKEYHIG